MTDDKLFYKVKRLENQVKLLKFDKEHYHRSYRLASLAADICRLRMSEFLNPAKYNETFNGVLKKLTEWNDSDTQRWQTYQKDRLELKRQLRKRLDKYKWMDK